MKARVHVRLKSGVLDPQGMTIQRSLQSLGYDEVSGVRQGKVFEMDLSATDAARARERLEEMSRRLLSNPVIEDFSVEIVEEES
ncbi:MAG: phosphoribosylformylglycinamidine synthase subunit PurS [Planctomycetota bacterium]